MEDVDWGINLNWILKKETEGMKWIHLAQGDTEGTVIPRNIADYLPTDTSSHPRRL